LSKKYCHFCFKVGFRLMMFKNPLFYKCLATAQALVVNHEIHEPLEN
jgi:hypothetical protein